MEEKFICLVEQTLDDAHGIFAKKSEDYGLNWRVYRLISIIDQIFIKAKRVETVTKNGYQKVNDVGDDIDKEFLGILNYSIMGRIQNMLGPADSLKKLGLTAENAIAYHKDISARFIDYVKSQNPYMIEQIEALEILEFAEQQKIKTQRMKSIYLKDRSKIVMFGGFSELMLWSIIGKRKFRKAL